MNVRRAEDSVCAFSSDGKRTLLSVTTGVTLVFVGLLMAPLIFYIYLYSPGSFLRTTRIGDEIIEALKRCHKSDGVYPNHLADLKPKYLKEIKPPVWGMRVWMYERKRDSFELRVNSTPWSGNGVSRYLVHYGTKGKWETGD